MKEWREMQARVILTNNSFSLEQKVEAFVEALSQAYTSGERDGRLQMSIEALMRRDAPFSYMMPPPPSHLPPLEATAKSSKPPRKRTKS